MVRRLYYEGDALPENSVPVWTRVATDQVDGTTTRSLAAGILTIQESAGILGPQTEQYSRTEASFTRARVIARFRITAQETPFTTNVQMRDAGQNKAIIFGFSNNNDLTLSVGSASGTYSGLDPTLYHVYELRLTTDSAGVPTAALTVDGVLLLTVTGDSAFTPDTLRWVVQASSPNGINTTDVDYVRYILGHGMDWRRLLFPDHAL